MPIVILGKVIHGDGYGKQLGFPTANLDRRQYQRQKLQLKLGIYAATAIVVHTKEAYLAAVVTGPLDARGLPKLEAHLIGFNGNLYGKHVALLLEQYIRPFQPYATEKKLIAAIKKDILTVKKYFV